ncbi:cytochrome c oxidase subunit 3 [Wenzhouxiangella marina]|uniref:cytochrome-c oxidase n=1 Tax=Wenzhouxiangella marina TaxID=1579979 RepID=A0A0K0XWA5_9GAMM|nr:cytochrome c oxidase subunit 3 [Wenzhouxiangella marina]AKS41955.1 MFS transporter [Wenzhouxiangella marina]MBB6086278.1 cytochrome c oxidase subunit 3 [Wenzhouxiangella marina]
MAQGNYYVPHTAKWPIVGSIGLFIMMIGAANWLNEASSGPWFFAAGAAVVITMMFGWFAEVIRESEAGMYNSAVDTSFRQGMIWFIFSEVMFFAAFFGALFYARMFAVPWLGGEGTGAMTNQFLYPGFEAVWPTNGPAEMGGSFQTISGFGLPLVNTLLLLTSGVTITMAHWALKRSQRGALIAWMIATILLGVVFLYVQMYEYAHAYKDLGLTLGSGIYGSTFFMLTGFHGLHVTVGAIMLTVITVRCAMGHFTKKNHFGFEAVAWYWHFVDVVWLGLFIFVYIV